MPPWRGWPARTPQCSARRTTRSWTVDRRQNFLFRKSALKDIKGGGAFAPPPLEEIPDVPSGVDAMYPRCRPCAR